MQIAHRLLAPISLVLALWLAPALATSGPDGPIDLFELGAPSFTTFSPRDGVPDSVSVSLQTDHDGFVWLASAQGLARYDGRSWNATDPPAIQGVLGNLMIDHDGTLWAAFRNGGIARYDGAQWHIEDHASSGLVSNYVRRLIETVDAQGHFEFWAAMVGAGLQKRDAQGQWIDAPGNKQLPAFVTSVARTHTLGGHERLWAGTGNEGLWFRDENEDWQRLHDTHFDPFQVEHLLVTVHDGSEELWIATFGNGLWRLDQHGLRNWSIATGDLPTDQLYDMAESQAPGQDHAIWVASRSGLIRIYHDRVQVFDRRYGLPSNVVRGLNVWRAPDGTEVLWLATENGVARAILGANQWQTASLLGMRESGAFGVLLEPDGNGGERLWVGSTGDGLGLYEHGVWRTFSQASGDLPGNDVHMVKRIAEADGGTSLWVGLDGGHLLRVREGPKFESVAVPWELRPGQAVFDMIGRTVDGHYERWFATRQSGLYRWRDGAWSAWRADGTAGHRWPVSSLAEQIDSSGRSWLWAASPQGLVRIDDERPTLLGAEVGLPDLSLIKMTLLPNVSGRQILWIGSSHSGIERVDVSDPLHPVTLPADLPPPPDPTAYGAQRDSRGRVYICTNNGVQLLTPATHGYTSRVYTRRDGMVHDECNGGAQFIDAHDHFWTGTIGGVTVFDPDRDYVDRQSKPLKVTQVRIDDVPLPNGAERVPPGQHELRVDFALLSWNGEERSVFRTQLLGYEAAPGAWSAQNFRSFNTLPPGDYVLRIEGRDQAGNLSTPVDLHLVVMPNWWQHPAAYAAFALLGLLFVYALLQWRTRSLKAGQRRLEKQVEARTSALNVANARLLELSYQDALTGLANRRRLLEALDGMAHDGTTTALIFVDVDHFKNYNDHFGHPAGDEALHSIAQAMRDSVPADAIVARYGGEEFACLLPGTERAQGSAIAERIRAAVENCDVAVPGTTQVNKVTISAGVASRAIATAADTHRLLRDADTALYEAKRDGRNCVRG